MAGELCLDTTALIHFEKAGHLDVLERLCTVDSDAFVTAVVVGEWRGHSIDPAGHVTGLPWLRVVVADDPADLQVIADLGQRYPTPPDKNQGEMDVVAVSHRLGFTALMEDGIGGRQADDFNVTHISMVTLLAAAVAWGKLPQRQAWRVHRDVEASRHPYKSILHVDAVGKYGFAGAVAAFQLTKDGYASFTAFLAQPNLDGQLLAAARTAMNTRP